MEAADWIAIYAAIVATGALFLEVRRWRESGVRLTIDIKPEMVMAGGIVKDDRRLLIVTVSNRGEAPTTLTHFGMIYFDKRPIWPWSKPAQSFIVPKPAVAGMPGLPHVLQPGQQWMGIAARNDDLAAMIASGGLVVEIWSSDSGKPWKKRIPATKPILEGATEISPIEP